MKVLTLQKSACIFFIDIFPNFWKEEGGGGAKAPFSPPPPNVVPALLST